jgi:hypothetical protein
MLPGSKPK